MINETKQRIEAYKAALPGIKERIVAAALLLVISVAMVTSASFAWITLSRAPEVSNVTTSIAGNGNLEIALVAPDGSVPLESMVGDSSAAQGNTITKANTTWGNLINLSDPSYGLSNIVLRPALLSNASNILNQPLKGANYGDDGRVELYYNENFQFTNWVEPANGLEGYFGFNATPQYGVRAISTVKYEYKNSFYQQFTQMMAIADGEWGETDSSYAQLLENDKYINALAGLIGQFMTDKLNDSNTNISKYMQDVYDLMLDFEQVMYNFEDALVALANAQVYNFYSLKANNPDMDPELYKSYTYTRTTLFEASSAELTARGINLPSMKEYISLRARLLTVLYGDGVYDPDDPNDETDTYVAFDCIEDYYKYSQAGNQVLMTELQPYVNKLVNINKCQIICEGSTYTVGNLGMSAATQLLGKDIDAVITEGILKDFEKMTGCRMCATDVDVQAKYIVTVTMTAKTITTNAVDPYTFIQDSEDTEAVAANNKGEYTATAQDTYGMAIDFWVRTNVKDSYLVLEGNVLTKTEMVRETGVDKDGNTVELYTVTVSTTYTDENGAEQTATAEVAAYKGTVDGAEAWFNATSHQQIDSATVTKSVERMKEVTTVIGYEGENRVWDSENNIFLSTDNTTQGSGSCYVFYAEDPAQQERSLNLLKNLRVAFIDCNESSATYGKVIGMARLDIENRYEASGKVTLPLVLFDDGSNYLTKTEDGMAIMALDQNTPTRISAIVYLDGSEISNSEVLAANDIQGQLNIQFGSTSIMTAMSNEELELATRKVSAVASATSGSFGTTNSLIEFNYDEASETNPMTVYVKVAVDGDQPTNLTAFFMRRVNATQGSREPSFELKKGEDGYWYGEYTFTAPGQYVLRTVQLDGVDYDLPVDENEDGNPDYPQVKVNGFTITNVSVQVNNTPVTDRQYTYMTGNNSVSTALSLQFASDGTSRKMPSSVRLQYQKDDGTQVSSTLAYNSNTTKWTGTANFTTSGTYTLKYVIMDGEYSELDAAFQREIEVYVGMTVEVWDDDPSKRYTTYLGESISPLMYVQIYDDTGEEVKYLTNAKLVYTRANTTVDGMSPSLKWNDAEGCYEATLQIRGPGIYVFGSVMVGDSVLKNTVNTPPEFTCMSPEPPDYIDASPMAGKDYELYSEGNNTLGVKIKNAEAATVIAVMENRNAYGNVLKTEYVKSAGALAPDYETFMFVAPYAGNWTIVELRLANVYDKDSNLYTEENPMIIDLRGKTDDLNLNVVDIKVTVVGESEDLTGSGFMASATATNAIKIIITDQNDQPLDPDHIDIDALAASLKLTYEYQTRSSESYGGYYSEDGEKILENITLLHASNDGKTFTLGKITLGYAGRFEPTSLSFTIADGSTDTDDISWSYSITHNADGTSTDTMGVPIYTLTTPKPIVTVTAVNTAAGTTFTTTKVSGGAVVEVPGVKNTISAEKDHAVVYMKGSKNSLGNWSYTLPSVTLKLENVAALDSATLTMVNEADSSVSHVFNFSSAKMEVTQTIGKIVGATGGHDTKYLAGATTFTEIPITLNGVEYIVQLENSVTIEQPEAPFLLSFGGIPVEVPEDQIPSTVTADGATVTVYLPKIEWTETTAADPVYSSWSAWSEKSIRTDYSTYSQKILFATYTRYNYYVWTEYTRTRTVTGSTTGQNMEIASWTINGKTYEAGKTHVIVLDGDSTATANVTSVGDPFSMGNTTTTETEKQYGYVAGKTGQSSTPSGGKNLGTASGFSEAPAPKLYSDGYTYTDINGYEAAWP